MYNFTEIDYWIICCIPFSDNTEEDRVLIYEGLGGDPGPYKKVGWWNRGKSHEMLYGLRNSYVMLEFIFYN